MSRNESDRLSPRRLNLSARIIVGAGIVAGAALAGCIDSDGPCREYCAMIDQEIVAVVRGVDASRGTRRYTLIDREGEAEFIWEYSKLGKVIAVGDTVTKPRGTINATVSGRGAASAPWWDALPIRADTCQCPAAK